MTPEELARRNQQYQPVPSGAEVIGQRAGQALKFLFGRNPNMRDGQPIQPQMPAPTTAPIQMPTVGATGAPGTGPDPFAMFGAREGEPTPQLPAAGSPQAQFLEAARGGLTPQQIAQGQAAAQQMGTTFSPETGFARQEQFQGLQPQMPTPQAGLDVDPSVQATRERLGAMFPNADGTTTPQTLTELTTGIQGAVMAPDAQGRLRTYESQEAANQALQAGLSAYDQESAAREARLGATLADRAAAREAQRGGDSGQRQYTDAQIRDLSGGDPELRRRYKAMDEQGIDPVTGQPRATGELTPEQQVARERLELDKARFDRQRTQAAETVSQENKEAFNKDVAAMQQVFADTARVQEAAGRAGEQAGFWTAGFFAPLKYIGGTGAADLRGSLTEVQADAAFDTLRAMKEASPTGGALGQVSNKEIELLGATRGSLEQAQSPEQLKANLERYQELRNDIMQRAKQGFIATYGQDAFNATFGEEAGVTAGNGEFVAEGGEKVTFTVEEV